MREFGKVKSSIWRSKKFKKLKGNDDARHLFLFLLTWEYGNSIGCYVLDLDYAAAVLGWKRERIDSALIALSEVTLALWDSEEEVVLIVDFLKRSPLTNTNHAIGAAKAALALPSSPLKDTIIEQLQHDKYGVRVDLLKTYKKTSDSPLEGIENGEVSDRAMDTTETETETETSLESNTTTSIPSSASDQDEDWVWSKGLPYLDGMSSDGTDVVRQRMATWVQEFGAGEVRGAVEASQVKAAMQPLLYTFKILQNRRRDKRAGIVGPSPKQNQANTSVHENSETNQWRSRVRFFKSSGDKEWDSQWGLTPCDPGCEAPTKILAEFGYGEEAA